MSELDLSRAPRGVLAAQPLVLAVAGHGDLAERHYLELKSALDLSTKRDKEKIAKFILGAANRMPDVAAAAFEGCGVMIIGVTKGAVTGIPPVEMMEIAKVIQQYVGAAGPRWDIVWVPVEGSDNQVLVVVVDPPEFGQGPFPCRANGASLTSGRIYIRADGETREANAEELDLLLKRGSALPKPEVDFAVEILGDVSAVWIDDNRTVEQYLGMKSGQLLAALPTKELPSPTGFEGAGVSVTGLAAVYGSALQGLSAASSIANAMSIPEERTEEEYREAIDRWQAHFRASWSTAKSKVAASQMTPVIVRITNRTTTFFHDVELRLHLAGEVFAFDFIDPEWADNFSDLELPRPPRAWGPRQRTFDIPNYAHHMHMSPMPPRAYTPPSVSFRNGGSVDLNLDVGELRPLGSYESEDKEFVLVVADKALPSIHGTWALTARDHNEVYKGEVDLPVAGERDFTTVARLVLGLDANSEGARDGWQQ